MRNHKILSATLATLMIGAQFGWTAVAAAEDVPTPTPTETATPEPTPTATPEPTPSATPTPTPEQTPVQQSTPTPSASPEPTPAPEKKKWSEPGPDGCGGVIPNWVFDVSSRTWVAADKESFSCDKASGYYLSPKYYFDKRIGWYEIIPPAVAATNPDYLISAPNVVHTVLGDLVIGSTDYNIAKSMGLLTDGAGGILVPQASAGINGTGADSTNQVGINGGSQSWIDLTNLVNIVNMIQSNAASGNVDAASNTTTGNASTGAATVVANLINLLASAWSWSNGNLNFFMQTLCNFNQTCNGDINLNPTATNTGGGGQLGQNNSVGMNGTGADSTNTVDINNPNTLDVNVQNSGNITNNVNVNAQSGDVNGTRNTTLGNIATGPAMAEVNIINLINSFISSGSSFFGVLNILGNLNGDILFPDGFLNGLIGPSAVPAAGGTSATLNGTGSGSENLVGVNNGSSTTVNSTSANAVNNNILTTANSGSANLDANTTVGNVNSGAASTNQSLFNLANSTIFGDNAVLVMVNVLGHWVGKIMTIPGTGQTQAALLTGNAVTMQDTGADSTNRVNVNNPNETTVNQDSVGTITNNVSVNAGSGNANLSQNTTVGDVSTGQAQANSSVANLFNTVLNVKHWFGVLVINVVGEWTGAVNEDTEAGDAPAGAGMGGTAPAAGAPAHDSLPAVGLLTLVKPLVASTSTGSVAGAQTEVSADKPKVLTAAANTDTPKNMTAAAKAKNVSLLFIISALVMLVAGAMASIDRKLKRR